MRNINEIIVTELRKSSSLRTEHIKEALKTLSDGDTRTGLLMLRNVVNASCGFAHLGKSLNINSKSLMRMLSASGNPKANHLFKIIGFLLKNENVRLNITKRAA